MLIYIIMFLLALISACAPQSKGTANLEKTSPLTQTPNNDDLSNSQSNYGNEIDSSYAPYTVASVGNVEFCTTPSVKSGGILGLKMDYYKPVINKKTPAVIMIHGGSWSGGLRGGLGKFGRAFAQNGIFSVTIDYRLSFEGALELKDGAHLQDMVSDIRCAVRHLKANSDFYNIDPSQVGIFGTSAGGHLAMQAGIVNEITFDSAGLYLNESDSVAAVVNWFGPTDLRYTCNLNEITSPYIERLLDDQECLSLSSLDWVMGNSYFDGSPINFVTSQDPSTLIIHGTKDATAPIENSYNFFNRAIEINHDSTLVEIVNGNHGFCNQSNETIALNYTINFFRDKLGLNIQHYDWRQHIIEEGYSSNCAVNIDEQ